MFKVSGSRFQVQSHNHCLQPSLKVHAASVMLTKEASNYVCLTIVLLTFTDSSSYRPQNDRDRRYFDFTFDGHIPDGESILYRYSVFVEVFGGNISTVFSFYGVEFDGEALKEINVLQWLEDFTVQ